MRSPSLKYNVSVWLVLGAMLLVWALSTAVPKAERAVYSDLATHVMIASSLWSDGDLRYTLKDLERFRGEYPRADGPHGLFLKINDSGDLYYAKPYLYGSAAAPFYGAFEGNGFIVFNVLCLAVIGITVWSSVGASLGANWGLFASVAFVLPSAFLPWVFVPHPDLFIAALLAFGSFLLLREQSSSTWNVIGAVVLGAALHEKVPFIFVLPFLVAAVPAVGWVWRFTLGAIILLSWLLFSLPNLSMDGSLLSYQGIRYYASGNPYPLETGWVPPASGFTNHVFDPLAVLAAIAGNVHLLPEKVVDFLVGRQTGIIPYFATAFVLLLIRAFFGASRSLLALAGFFSYLVAQWLVFPTNGYGGAGSYGSRYLMQALPLIPLSYLGVSRSSSSFSQLGLNSITRTILVISVGLGLTAQYRVFQHGSQLVQRYYTANIEPPLNAFPVEHWLLPTTFIASAPNKYVDQMGEAQIRIYRLDEMNRGSWLAWAHSPHSSTFVLYKDDSSVDIAEIEIISPIDTEAKINFDDRPLWSGKLYSGQPQLFRLSDMVSMRSAFDLLLKREIGISRLELYVDRVDRYSDGAINRPLVRFFTGGSPFGGTGERLGLQSFVDSGAELLRGWSHLEPWGVWSDGVHADIAAWVGPGMHYEVELVAHAYIPPSKDNLEVDFRCNGSEHQRMIFRPQEIKTIRVPCLKRDEHEFILIGVDVVDPTSPLAEGRGPDPRRLGIGLHSVRIDRLE